MKQPFTTDDYLQAIQRELGKRATTYPKIIEKMIKVAAEVSEVEKRHGEMMRQNALLKSVMQLIKAEKMWGEKSLMLDWMPNGLTELIRELKERKRCYPRWVKLYRMMTQETADYEIAVWESLTRWFAKEYLDLEELPTNRKRK